MIVLIDANVLLRMSDPQHAQYAVAFQAVELLDSLGFKGAIVPQVLYEYWVVATRPLENNGLGLTVARAEKAIHDWSSAFPLLLDERGIYVRWQALVVAHEVKGKPAHDARIVAAMLRHGVKHLLTFNASDFRRFPDVNVYTPAEIIAGAIPT